jgi:hypothetical protein
MEVAQDSSDHTPLDIRVNKLEPITDANSVYFENRIFLEYDWFG